MCQYQTFRHGPILYWTARWRYALETLFSSFFLTYYDLFGRATCGVSIWNGGLTASTASVHYLHCVLDYEECLKKSLVASVASSVALHGLPETDHCR